MLKLALLILFAVAFTVYPKIDLYFTNLFWAPGEGFPIKSNPFIEFVNYIVPPALKIFGVGLLIYIIADFIKPGFAGNNRAKATFLLLALLLGPVLVTNVILKDNWGRARPDQVTEFGGSQKFTLALIPSDQCPKNCSFIAGHAAGGYYAFALAMLITNRKKRITCEIGAILLGFAVGVVRVSEGKHFLSDVLFSGLINITIFELTYWLIFRARKINPQAVTTNSYSS